MLVLRHALLVLLVCPMAQAVLPLGKPSSSIYWVCGTWGESLICRHNDTHTDIVIGMCQSGENPDCSSLGQTQCKGMDTWAAILCAPDRAAQRIGSASDWQYSDYGKFISCADSSGSVAIGACGSGSNPDCQNGQATFGIDCSKNEAMVNKNDCEWTYHQYGLFFSCPETLPLLAGMCGSGENTDCKGATFATQCCSAVVDPCMEIKSVSGSWQQISSSSSPQTVEYYEGVTRSRSITDTSTWASQVSVSMELSFEFAGFGSKIDVSASYSEEVAHQYSSTFEKTTSEKYTFNFDGGVVWQWQFDIKDGCNSQAKGRDVRLTPGSYAPPCCLPGFEEDIKTPHGPCHGTSPNICTEQSNVSLVV